MSCVFCCFPRLSCDFENSFTRISVRQNPRALSEKNSMAVKLFLDAQGKAKFLALILNEISVQLSDSVHRNINEKCVIFLKTLIFDERFGRYRLNVPFCDDIGRCLS